MQIVRKGEREREVGPVVLFKMRCSAVIRVVFGVPRKRSILLCALDWGPQSWKPRFGFAS